MILRYAPDHFNPIFGVGGIDLETKEIDYKSFINIRPSDNNRGNDIVGSQIKKTFEEIMRYFFKDIL